MIIRTRLALLVLLSLLTGIAAAGGQQAGQLIYVQGTVSIIDRHQGARGAKTGAALYEGETIVTGSRSMAQLRLSDGALASLRSNTRYTIEQQRFDEEAGLYQQAGRLLAGWMRSVTGAIGARNPENVSHHTPVATIGIRGTMYQTIHVPEEGLPDFPDLAPGSYIYLEEGGIQVSNPVGSLRLRPGQVAVVESASSAPQLRDGLIRLFRSDPVNPSPGSGTSPRQPAGERSGDGWIDQLREGFDVPFEPLPEVFIEEREPIQVEPGGDDMGGDTHIP